MGPTSRAAEEKPGCGWVKGTSCVVLEGIRSYGVRYL